MAKTQKIRRKKRLFGTPERPRLVVFRSIKHISGQIIDDANQRTLVGAAD
nr:50S ribosomal protein L18 [Calditrichia bacterium]